MGFLDSLTQRALGSGPRSAGTVSKTTPAVAERIKNILGIRQLEPMPAQAARAFQLTCDARATASDFVNVIEADEVLSARVIRVANSVYFFRGTPANDIDKAVANIGLNELRCLLSASLLRGLMKGNGGTVREQIWGNSVGTAVAAKMLSHYTNGITEGEAFLCGLVHDVGKLVMIQRAAELYKKVIVKVGSGESDFCEAEEALFEVDHIEVGKWVAESWRFPDPAVAAVAGHHNSWDSILAQSSKQPTTALLVKAADTICHASGIGHTAQLKGYQRRASEELTTALSCFGFSTAEGDQFIEKLKQKYDKEFGMFQMENHS